MPGPPGPSSRQTVGGTRSQPRAVGQLVRRDLATRQGPLREVPQRALPGDRLVHAPDGLDAGRAHEAAQGGVRGVAQPPLDLEVAVAQQCPDGRVRRSRFHRHARRRYPLERGQMCPAGSSGWLQNGHGGRPAETTWRARSANARAYAGVSHTRKVSGPSVSSSAMSGISTSSSDDGVRLDDDATTAPRPSRAPWRRPGTPPRSGRRGARVRQQRRGRIGDLALLGSRALRLVEQLVDALRQHHDLGLLQGDARHEAALPCLQEEGPLPRHAHRAHDEAVRGLEVEAPDGSCACSAADGRVAGHLGGAACGVGAPARRALPRCRWCARRTDAGACSPRR